MADQVQRSASGRIMQAVRIVPRSSRSASFGRPEECSDDVVVFEARSAAGDRRADSQDPSQTGRHEAAATVPGSQGAPKSGDEHSSESAPSEQSTPDKSLPHGSVRCVTRSCKEQKSKCWVLLGLACLGAAIILALFISRYVRTRPAEVPPAAPLSWLPWRERIDDNGLPRLLLWNADERGHPSFLSNKTKGGGQSLFNTTVCEVEDSRDSVVCEITDKRQRLAWSDAIVFYGEHFNLSDMPAERADLQMWVFWARSRLPPIGKGIGYNPLPSLPLVAGSFNWTMAKREDADVVVSHDTFRCRTSPDMMQNMLLDRRDDPLVHPKGDVAWIFGKCEWNRYEEEISSSSHGHDESVQSRGTVSLRLLPACGVHLCASPKECIRFIADRYHFILVTLWPECFQTVYEVIHEAFKYDLVPVVLMPPKERLNVPKNSVITSEKLQGKGELANYLRSVLDIPKMYDRYFEWKQSCSVIPPENDMCALCRAMWKTPVLQRPQPNVLEWWTRSKACQGEPLYGLDSAFVIEP